MLYKCISILKHENILNIKILPLFQEGRLFQLSNELFQLCDEINQNSEICAVVVTDNGENSFDMGEDLREFLLKNKDIGALKNYSISEPISRINQPTIAAVTGNAIACGLELILACDIRIASETSQFSLSHIQNNIIPMNGGTQRLPRLIGKGWALEMILTGKILNAQEAYRIGLINKVTSKEGVAGAAMDLAKEICLKGPIALRYAKEAIYKGMDMSLDQGLRLEADLYLLIHTTKDRREGIKAFLEKRTPKFEGK